jgi:hypothetical protein
MLSLFISGTRTVHVAHGFQNVYRAFQTPIGSILLSILFGLACATLFQRPCESEECVTYEGPLLQVVDGQVMRYGNQCFYRTVHAALPDPARTVVPVGRTTSVHEWKKT